MIRKPPKGTARAAQHARTLAARLARRKAHPYRLRRGKPPARVGKIGKRQLAWQARMHRVWHAVFGHAPWPAVVGPTELGGAGVPVVCGHIESCQLRPDLRMDPCNVAPITREANRLMMEDLAFRAHAQERMRDFVTNSRADILRLYDLTP